MVHWNSNQLDWICESGIDTLLSSWKVLSPILRTANKSKAYQSLALGWHDLAQFRLHIALVGDDVRRHSDVMLATAGSGQVLIEDPKWVWRYKRAWNLFTRSSYNGDRFPWQWSPCNWSHLGDLRSQPGVHGVCRQIVNPRLLWKATIRNHLANYAKNEYKTL